MKKMLKLFVILFCGYLFLLFIMYVLQEKLIFIPEKLSADYRFPYQAKEINFEVANGVQINALHFQKEKSKGLILYFHGNAGSLAGWGDVQRSFSSFPYDFLIMDYRGYGKSTGHIRQEADLHTDAEMIYQEISKRYKPQKVILYGRSIGTGIAAHLATKVQPEMLILETPYFNFSDLVKRIYPFVPTMMLRYRFANDRYLQELRCPIVLIHGTNDGLIPYDSSIRLAKISDKIGLVSIEGGEHNNLSAFPEYHQELKKIFAAIK